MQARRRTSQASRVLVTLGLMVYVVYAFRYIYSMSIEAGGERWFLLWDDAMISMQYAKNLAAGNGLVWNAGGEAVQGFTNLGVTLVMAVLHLFPVPPRSVPLLFQVFNLVILIVILFSMYRMGRLLFGDSPWAGYGAAILTAFYGPLAIWGLQGADFNLLACITLLSLESLVGARLKNRPPSLWVFAGLALGIVVRLDFSIVYATVWIWCVVFAFPRRSLAFPGLLIGAGVCGLLLGFNVLYFGDLLPNTYYLKATGTPKSLMLQSGIAQLFDIYGGVAFVGLSFFGLYSFLLLREDPFRLFALLFALVLGQFAYFIWVGGDWVVVHTSRYLMVAMPLYILLLVGGAWEFLRGWRAKRGLGHRPANAIFVLQLLLFVWLLNPAPSVAEWLLQDKEPMYRENNVDSLQFARAICEFTNTDTKVGLFWAGVTPYLCEREYLDLLGRADRHIARKRVSDFRGPGHSKWDWGYVFEQARPDILATTHDDLVKEKDFERLFCLARLPTPRVVFPVRKDSAGKILDSGLRLCHPSVYPPCLPCTENAP